jgi:hypothetical protein
VLVTAFEAVTSHAQLGVRHLVGAEALVHANATIVHGLDDVFGLGALFSLAALAMVVLGIRPARQSAEVLRPEVDESDEAALWLERQAG